MLDEYPAIKKLLGLKAFWRTHPSSPSLPETLDVGDLLTFPEELESPTTRSNSISSDSRPNSPIVSSTPTTSTYDTLSSSEPQDESRNREISPLKSIKPLSPLELNDTLADPIDLGRAFSNYREGNGRITDPFVLNTFPPPLSSPSLLLSVETDNFITFGQYLERIQEQLTLEKFESSRLDDPYYQTCLPGEHSNPDNDHYPRSSQTKIERTTRNTNESRRVRRGEPLQKRRRVNLSEAPPPPQSLPLRQIPLPE